VLALWARSYVEPTDGFHQQDFPQFVLLDELHVPLHVEQIRIPSRAALYVTDRDIK
jgi:hypothetical protein